MFVAKCKPSSYKVAPGDYAIDANGEIAIVINDFIEGRCSLALRCIIGDCSTSHKHNLIAHNHEIHDRITWSFEPIKYIAKADIIDHFNINVIYNYRTYTQAFYDIFALNGDDIILKDRNSNSNSSSNPMQETIDDLVSRTQEIIETLPFQDMVMYHEQILHALQLVIENHETTFDQLENKQTSFTEKCNRYDQELRSLNDTTADVKCLQVQLIRYQQQMKVRDNILAFLIFTIIVAVIAITLAMI